MKKLNREAVAKFASRFFLVVMSFMLILSLCSMASPSGEFELTIQNPDNIPQDYSIEYYSIVDIQDDGVPLTFGSNTVFGTLTNGIEDGEQYVPTGNYAAIYVLGENLDRGTALTCNGVSYKPLPDIDLVCYVTDNPVITVTDDYSEAISGMFIFVPIETPTSSISSVWTSITNWVISSLNTVQGIFYGAGEEVYAPDTSSSDVITYEGVSFYPLDFLSAEELGGGRVFLNGTEIFEDGVSQSFTTINGQQFVVASNGGVPIMLLNTTTNGTYSPVGLEIVVQSDGSLTLLGTLAVIGLSIAVAFLLIGIIQRFLMLRG